MNETTPERPDPLIEDVRARRRRLVAEHGGLQAWARYLRARQNEHREKVIPPPNRVDKPPPGGRSRNLEAPG